MFWLITTFNDNEDVWLSGVEAFVSHGGDIEERDCEEFTPFLRLIKDKKFKLAYILIDKFKANINAQSNELKSALHFTCEDNNLQSTSELLKWGINPSLADKKGRTPFHLVLSKSSELNECLDSKFDLESLLLSFEININALDKWDRTPLHYAFITIGNYWNSNQIDPVLKCSSICSISSCDPNIQDCFGKTPLHYAA